MKRSRADREARVTFVGLARTSFWVIFGGIWLLVGLPFLIIGVVTARDEWRFKAQGQTVDGIVLSKDIRGKSSDRKYMVHYRFMTDEGRDVERTAEVDLAVWERLREREAVRVVYRPGGAMKTQIEGESRWTGAVVFSAIGTLLTVLGGSLVLRAIFRILDRLRASRPFR